MMCNRRLAVVLLVTGVTSQAVFSESIRVGIVQTVIESSLEDNCNKLLGFIDRARAGKCQIAIFPEGALYWPEIAVDSPTRADLHRAIERIGQKADSDKIYVAFGTGYKLTDTGPYHNRAVAYDPNGHNVLFYKKNAEVPQRFYVHGVPFNLVICSDRGYLEHSDLPCLAQGSQVVIDISGGHGGDDGRPDLRWIRYRPWATRTGAYVIVSNPVHDDTDFMGHSPWGGGSAVIRPDGSIQACYTYEKDALIVEDIDISKATRLEAKRRRNHPIFKPFWDMGAKLLEGEDVGSIPDITPYSSAEREIKIAVAQMACSREMGRNVGRIKRYIHQARDQGADTVVFPELAVTGFLKDDIYGANQSELQNALDEIRSEADSRNIYVIVGMPYFVDSYRRNCALAIGDDGSIKTRYAQISASRNDLFQPGSSTKAMWFDLKGVRSIVTIGDDANLVEIGDFAASRGMYLHFHITYEACPSPEEATLFKQRHLLLLMYAKYGAVVNAANASGLSHPSSAAGGMSMIVSREGGHNKPSPNGLEYYLPYQTSIAKSAGSAETMIIAMRNTSARNDMDLFAHWRNQNRRNRIQSGWYEWIKKGTLLIEEDAKASVSTGTSMN
ncbi:MAG: carbon-nitrogen hydrolase family protein [Phycisphaerales bacterium]